MTTLGSVDSTALQWAQQPPQRPKAPSFDTTAQVLGMSTSDLQSALQSGQTMDDLAKARGVSQTDLTNAVKTDLQAGKPADAPDLSDDQLTQMATGIAAGKGPHGAHGHHHHQPAASDDASTADANLSSLADSLGVSQTDLLGELKQGAHLSTLLSQSPATNNPYSADGSTTASVDGGLAVDLFA